MPVPGTGPHAGIGGRGRGCGGAVSLPVSQLLVQGPWLPWAPNMALESALSTARNWENYFVTDMGLF